MGNFQIGLGVDAMGGVAIRVRFRVRVRVRVRVSHVRFLRTEVSGN